MPVLTRSQRKKQEAEKAKTLRHDNEDIRPQGRRRRIPVSNAPKQSKPKRKRNPITKPKSKRKANSQTKPRRSRRKSISNSSKQSDTASLSSSSSSSSNSNKRKLSKRDENGGTPPNKRKKTKSRDLEHPSPSKQLAKLMDTSLHINNSSIPYELKDEEDDQQTSETDEHGESPSRNERIKELQEKLLTQEHDYQLIGRDAEYNKIKKFIELRLKTGQGDSFYICGSPGTGKTATMQSITTYFMRKRYRYKLSKIIKLNGMSFSDPKSIYSVLYNQVFDTQKKLKPVDAKNKLEKFFVNSNERDMYMVVIDEMDGLLGSAQQQVLYYLFGWAKREQCRLILFGIANSIDLTDRFLPRLKQRNFEPELLIFEAYTKQQLIQIIQDRMKGYDYFEGIAIDLCATKVAKMYGDIRKCLEICRNALNLLLVKEKDKSSAQCEKIGFLQMRQILATSFESPLMEILSDLPNHQKTIIVIMSVLLNERITKKNQRYVCYSKLEGFYHFMSQKYNLPKTSSREFNSIIDSLITDNVVKVLQNSYNKALATKQKQIVLVNDTKLQLMVPTDDIQYAVQGDDTLHKFFQINVCVPHKFLF